ncbi:hypothetical protein BU52_11465 [Streptomyces toyocaensis]|uniref:Uncharacterized protein n=1 Tax=Streptomyces toyocaensis TaxID=55952 RepID=A0A081XUH6_STRTO|nr:hypothetical protein [Streptomyces toyocaensis]KES07199.1 hypothetical protein BU52_11465 [Streptomyces toyocaensis]
MSAFGRNTEDEELRETSVLPLGETPAGADVREAGSGVGSLEDRWARLGVLPSGNDRTRLLPDAAHRPEPWAGDVGGPAAAGRAVPSEGPADGSWDSERTTALRVPRQPGAHGTGTAGPSSRPGGARPSGDLGAAGSPPSSRRPSPDSGTAVFPVASGPSSDPGAPTEFLRSASVPGTPTASRTPVRDPWQEETGDSAAATHDPHEVTVQLDSVQIGEGLELRRTPGHAVRGQEAAGGPVFVDESGRRSRLYRRIGLAVGLACAGYAVVMVATLLSGNSDAPWMPVPGQEDKPAGQVETTPRPEETDSTPSAGTSLVPGDTSTTGTPTLPAPDATAPATDGGAGTADRPDAADPTPAPTGKNTTAPATDGGTTTTPPDDTVSTAPADPPASEEPDPVTTAPTGGGEAGGTDDVAGAPADQPVVVTDGSAAQPEPSTTPAAPSPENVL